MEKKNQEKKNIIRETWRKLSQSIYVGERLDAHLRMLFMISIVTIMLCVVLMIVNLATRQYAMLIASIITGVAGVACAYCARILKKEKIASLIPTIFCGMMFTIYVFTGAGNGSAILFSLLVPIGLCYFVSVKYGIILSAYYSILYSVIFFTPLRSMWSMYYGYRTIQRKRIRGRFCPLFHRRERLKRGKRRQGACGGRRAAHGRGGKSHSSDRFPWKSLSNRRR